MSRSFGSGIDDKTSQDEFSQQEDQQLRFRQTQQEQKKDESSIESMQKQPILSPSKLKQKRSNFVIRTVTTLMMLFGFIFIIAAGHFYCTLLVLFLTFGIFKEIIQIKRKIEIEEQLHLKSISFLNWFLFGIAIFYFFGKTILSKYTVIMFKYKIVAYLMHFLPIIAFSLWIVAFLIFVMTLRKGSYRYQFKWFIWAHAGIFFIVLQTSGIVNNIYEGMIWFIMPCLLVISNDIFAYIFGKSFGKTKLIDLSPNKTLEGFFGGFIMSVFWALVLSMVLPKLPVSQFLLCPQSEFSLMPFSYQKCEIPAMFVEKKLFNFFTLFEIHSIIFAIFASLIAPFGGFFASGLKRAFHIKDFADTIPGHGGIADRMDCQLLMGAFSHMYIQQIVLLSVQHLGSLTSFISTLDTNSQQVIFTELAQILASKQALPTMN